MRPVTVLVWLCLFLLSLSKVHKITKTSTQLDVKQNEKNYVLAWGKVSEDQNVLYSWSTSEGVTKISFTNTNPYPIQAETEFTLMNAEWIQSPPAIAKLTPNQETLICSYKAVNPNEKNSFSFFYTDITQPSLESAISTKHLIAENSNFEEVSPIVQQIISEKKPFIDADFPPALTSIYHDGCTKPKEKINWRRASYLFDAESLSLIKNEQVDAEAVVQGSLGDCWFLASVAGVAAINPMLIERLFITKTINEAGIYELRIFKNGKWNRVVVDDYIPCKNRSVIFSSSNTTEIWIMLLEKAYAKLHGSYMKIESGKPCESYEDLTGYPGVNIYWPTYWNNYTSNDVFHMIKSSLQDKCQVSISTIIDSSIEAKGLAPHHAYTVIEAVQIMNYKLLKLRNPWRRFEWNGEWADGSSIWNPELKAALKVKNVDDGMFWIEMGDIWKYFDTLNYGYFDLNYLFCNQRLPGTIAKRGPKFLSEAFELQVTEDDTNVCIAIHQQDPRMMTTTQPLRFLHAFLFDKSTSQLVADVTPSWKTRTIVMTAKLQAGKTYVILPWSVDQKDTQFIVSIAGTQQFTVAKEENAFQFAETIDFARAHDSFVPPEKYKSHTNEWHDFIVDTYKWNFTELFYFYYVKKEGKQQPNVKIDFILNRNNSFLFTNKEEPENDTILLDNLKPGDRICAARGCQRDEGSWTFSWKTYNYKTL